MLNPTCARIVGGPGSGKTTRLMEIIEMVQSRMSIDPMQIGFVSFTRNARNEAAKRAGDKFGVSQSNLEKHGWFRTLHSTAYRCMGVAPGELITGCVADQDWLRNAVDDDKVRIQGASQNDDGLLTPYDSSDAGRALALWDSARNRMVPLEKVWSHAADVDMRTPTFDECASVVYLYEDSKRRDGRIDFCDLLMRFAGKRWSGNHASPFDDVDPHGEVPHLPVWIHDEMQDCSLLTSLVFTRLIRNSTWVYLAGDLNQENYSWAGANGDIFANWPVAKEDFLPMSHRCDKAILDVGKHIIRDPRLVNFNPKNEGGKVLRDIDIEQALASLDPREDCLVLARTNEYVRQITNMLDDAGIPWKPTKSGDGPKAPARAVGVQALIELRKGKPISADAVWRLTQLIPSKVGSEQLLERGTKEQWKDEEYRKQHSHELWGLSVLDMIGATDKLKELIASGQYVELLEKNAQRMTVSAQKYGTDAVVNPTIRVGTAHSSKGGEADHVVLINKIPYPTAQSVETEKGMAEERRVWYVSATRARHKLTIAEGGGEVFYEL